MKKMLAIVLLLLLQSLAYAQNSLTIVAVGEATLEKDKMVIQEPYMSGLSAAEQNLALELVRLLRNNFSFYQKKFFMLETGKNNTLSRPATNYDHWNNNGVRYLGTASVAKSGNDLSIQVIFEDIRGRRPIYSQTKITSFANLRKTGHQVADEIYRAITGQGSIFNSKIVFVSDRNSRGRTTVKELYMMDFDGKNTQQLTSHGGLVISPAVSMNGRHLVYSLIPNGARNRNNNLYMMDLQTRKTEVISRKNGINSGAIFINNDKSIAVTLTQTGNAEIYEMNLETKNLRKITNHFGADVDPSITADGSLMAFLSDRPGRAMIYTMDPRATEKDVKRISFVGQFNATPRFSPDGKEIVFSSWLDNRFDLFRIASDGNGLSRLTKDFGSNEDPTYSPDGEFIAFTSQRVISRTKADQNIYIMDRDGGILGAVTGSFGNCISPRWFNPL